MALVDELANALSRVPLSVLAALREQYPSLFTSSLRTTSDLSLDEAVRAALCGMWSKTQNFAELRKLVMKEVGDLSVQKSAALSQALTVVRKASATQLKEVLRRRGLRWSYRGPKDKKDPEELEKRREAALITDVVEQLRQETRNDFDALLSVVQVELGQGEVKKRRGFSKTRGN